MRLANSIRHQRRVSLPTLRPVWPLALCLFVLGCGEAVYDEMELMPSPVIYSETEFSPFSTRGGEEVAAQSKLFYVTDRQVAGPEDKQPNYNNQRGQLARAGTAEVSLSPEVSNWQEFVNVTLEGNRDRKYLLNVAAVNEIGVLPYSVADLYPSPPSAREMDAAGRSFAKEINAQLALSKNKDVHIYIHGYNVDFEYSTLVGREIEHFL